MRLLLTFFESALLALITCPAWAHEEAEELGHHWEAPAYLHEIHLQLAIMAVIVAAVVVGTLIKRAQRKRGAQR